MRVLCLLSLVFTWPAYSAVVEYKNVDYFKVIPVEIKGKTSCIQITKASADSGTQTRTVVCKKYGATVSDSECSGAKPASIQQCTPTDSNKRTYTEECSEAGSSC